MSLFSQNTKFAKFMARLVDICFLNFLWIIFSLPVITAGAATLAAYSVALSMVDDEESYIFKSFIHAFRYNFKQGTLLLVLSTAALYALYIDAQLVFKSENPPVILCVISILSIAVVFCLFVYAYPLSARYNNTLFNNLRNSFSISIRYPLKTFIIFLVCAVEVFLFTFNLLMEVFGIFTGPMILVYTVSGSAKHIFLKIEREGNVKNTPSGTDNPESV